MLLTTYDFLINKKDAPRFAAMNWAYLILDEGHRIKNAECQLSQALRSYKIQHRLLLTGTPVHNKLLELWSLLHFLVSGLLRPLVLPPLSIPELPPIWVQPGEAALVTEQI